MNASRWLLALAVVSTVGLACSSRKSKCEEARDLWVADFKGQLAAIKKLGGLKEGTDKNLAVQEAAYVDLCLKRSDQEIECLTKVPPHVPGVAWKMDAKCEPAAAKMEADLGEIVENLRVVAESVAPGQSPRGSPDAQPKPSAVVNLDSLDWSSLPRWTWSLQRSTHGAYVSTEECPEARALNAKPAADEFERKDRESQIEKLKAACSERLRNSFEKIPQLATVSVPVFRRGDFDFDRKEFSLLLPGRSEYEEAAKKAHGTIDRLNGVLRAKVVDGVFVLVFGRAGEGSGVIALSGLEDGLVHAFSSGEDAQVADVFYLKVAELPEAKRLGSMLSQGATIEFLFEPDASKGSGITESGPFGALGATSKGLRGRVLAYRVLLKNQLVVGPLKNGETARFPDVPDAGTGRGGEGQGDAPAGKGVIDVLIAASDPIVMGSLDPELIRQVIHRNRGQIRHCYESQLAQFPKLSGSVTVKFVIAASGTVASSQVAKSDLGNNELEACVTDRVRTWLFPKPKGGGVVVVTYPFTLKQFGEK